MVAVKGDPDCEVNRGLLCVKGYANARILYGKDRLDAAAPAHEGRAASTRRATSYPVSWERAFDEMEAPVAAGPRRARADRRRHHGLRPVPGAGGLRGRQADEGRMAVEQHRSERAALHGIRGRRLHPDLRDRRAVRLLRRHRAHGHGRHVGRQHGRDAPHAVGAHRRRAPDAAGRLPGRQPHHLLEPVLRARRPRDRLQARTPTSRSGTTSPARS